MPEGVREDLVSNKRLSTFSMLAALQVIYQPGGQGEKTTLLKALESPLEASSAVMQCKHCDDGFAGGREPWRFTQWSRIQQYS